MRYWPNPVHKRETTVAGPPRWRPSKMPCPDDMTVAERDRLLETAIPMDPNDASSRRYNIRRTSSGLVLFDAKCHEVVGGEPAFHAHPATFVPGKILRQFHQAGLITRAEYDRLVKGFG